MRRSVGAVVIAATIVLAACGRQSNDPPSTAPSTVGREVTLDEAVTLIEERIAKGGGKAKAKTRASKAAKTKPPRAKARKAKVPAQAEEDAG